MIINELVYDRTQADVDRVFTLRNRILSGGLNALSEEERAEYMAGMKGAYNATDLNRIGEAVKYIADRMIALPGELEAYRISKDVDDSPAYHVPYDPDTVIVTAKRDWTYADTPTQTQMTSFLNDLSCLRMQLTLPIDAPVVPDSMDNLGYETANAIERLLRMIHDAFVKTESNLYYKIDLTMSGFPYAGIAYSGD